jgi:hypothetical protein
MCFNFGDIPLFYKRYKDPLHVFHEDFAMFAMNDQPILKVKRQRVMRSLLWGFLAVASCPAVVQAQSPAGQTLNPIMLSQGGNEAQLAVVKWAAFGSGCRAAEEIPSKERNVHFNILPKNASQTAKLVFELTFPEFGLKSGNRIEKDNKLELYSECALRFAIRGQPGKRLKKIEGLAKLEVQKAKGASLLIFNELKFGQFGSDDKRLEYDEQTELKKTQVDLNLSKALAPVRDDGKSSCGSDEVLFYDFTLFAKAANKASQVNVTFHPPKQAIVRLEYENCT